MSQGTVSNVLNGRGNVSSKKVRQVLNACKAMEYVPNERAKLLRKGSARVLGVLLPDVSTRRSIDFYQSFRVYAEGHGYQVRQYLPYPGSREAENLALQEAKSDMIAGMALLSGCLPVQDADLPSENILDMKVLYIEHRPDSKAPCLVFDYEKAGREMAQRAKLKGYQSILLVTGHLGFSNEAEFYQGFLKEVEGSACRVAAVQTSERRRYQNALEALEHESPEAIFCSNLSFAEAMKDALDSFYTQTRPCIYTISPVFTMPETKFEKYELNYRLLGHSAAQALIRSIEHGVEILSVMLENTGFRQWKPPALANHASSRPLNILTLDSPTASIMRNLAKLYTRETGVPVLVTIYSYDKIYEAFCNMREDSVFDVLRLDVTWLSWFAERLLRPLEEIDPLVRSSLGEFMPLDPYSFVNGTLYALPSSPSTQLLFYRRDLFESVIYRRMYKEQYHRELSPPQDFDEFNRVAAFFTRALHPESPVCYGATLTMGSAGVAGSEYLARLFALQENLYENGNVRLNSEKGVKALRQMVDLKPCVNTQLCSWWTDTAATFAAGDVAMALLYNNFAAPLLSHRSRVQDNIGYALVPGSRPLIGGGSVGVSRFSKQPDRALHFLRWMCSEPIASAGALLDGVSPCKQSYKNYEIVNTYPWMKLMHSSFSAARGRRIPPQSRAAFNERSFISCIGTAAKNAFNGIVSPKDALDSAQKQFEEQFGGLYTE